MPVAMSKVSRKRIGRQAGEQGYGDPTSTYPSVGEYWIGLHRLKLFWEVSRTDKSPTFDGNHRCSKNSRLQSCIKRKGGCIETSEKGTKSMDG